jgi:hypothetical protein
MKTPVIVLALSLAANAGLIAVLVSRSTDVAPTVVSPSPAAMAGASAAADAIKNSPHAAASGTAEPKTWEFLQTNDLPALVARLRAAGFPPNVVRRIVGTLVSERFDGRRLEIEKANLEAPFWTNPGNVSMDPKIGPELRKLQREQTDLMKQLLGGNLAELFAGSEEDRAMLRYQIGNISPDKLEQLYASAMDYSEKMTQIYSAASGGANRTVMLDSDREKLVAIDKAYRADLGKFLTPTEVNDFMLHNGQLAGQIRNTLMPLKLTEDEYRGIFPLYQAFMDQNPTTNFTFLTPDATPATRAAVDQLNSQVAALLGPARAADFQQANNPESYQINRLVSRLDLPLSAAAAVVAVQKDVQQRATALRMDASLEPSARAAQLTAMAQDAATKISTALGGARGLEAYKDNGGQWLMNLAPRPRPAAPTPKG